MGALPEEYLPKQNILGPDVLICEEVGAGQNSTNIPNLGWNQRFLNLIKVNKIGSQVILDQGQSSFKLPIGKYWVKIMSAAMRIGKHKVDLKNTNSGQHLVLGSCEHSEFGGTSTAALTRSIGEGELLVTDANHNFVLMHHVQFAGTDAWQFGQGGEGPAINCKIELWSL